MRVAQACSSENFTAWGRPGNQRRTAVGTDGELEIRDYYADDWTDVFRAKSRDTAEKIASCMEAVVRNKNVGYAQNNGAAPRTGLYDQLAAGVKPEAVELCNTDCSAAVAACVMYAGVPVSKNMYTGNEKAVLIATGAFDCFTEAAYTMRPDLLRRGDILLKKGHTLIVLDDAHTAAEEFAISNCVSCNVRTGPATSYMSIGIAKAGDVVESLGTDHGWHRVLHDGQIGYISPLFMYPLWGKTFMAKAGTNIRAGAGTTKKKLLHVKKGTELKATGGYSLIGTRRWYQVKLGDIKGYCSDKYLRT